MTSSQLLARAKRYEAMAAACAFPAQAAQLRHWARSDREQAAWKAER